jgi:membrane protease YdiL (CAAX protease family)
MRFAIKSYARWPVPTAYARGWTTKAAIVAFTLVWITIVASKTMLQLSGIHLDVAPILASDAVMWGAVAWLGRLGSVSLQDLGVCCTPAMRAVAYTVLAAVVLILFDRTSRYVVGTSETKNFASISEHGILAIATAGTVACVIAPVSEEIFFRGVVYRCLRNRVAMFWSVTIAGAMFGVIHLDTHPLDALPFDVAFGVVACLLYERTGSLLPCISLHCLVDTAVFVVAVGGTQRAVLVLACVVAGGIVVLSAIRTIRQAMSRSAA